MTEGLVHYICDDQAVEQFVQYCREAGYRRFNLVCDTNTHPILGQRVASALNEQGWPVRTILLKGSDVIAGGSYLVQVFNEADPSASVYLAVGSGTINDITRYCSFNRNTPFISLPTAPSVDGFASVVAPIVVNGFKDTYSTQPPLAIFADLNTLCSAPKSMIAAGFGDILGKYTALADWKLGRLLWDEPFSPEIASRMAKALDSCVRNAEGINQASAQGVTELMFGLVESGICMLLNGNSRPASGAEHHLAHYWEMKLLRQGRTAILHGAMVGVGTVLIARRWEQIRDLPEADFKQLLLQAALPDTQGERNLIQSIYGPISEQVCQEQTRFLSITPADFNALRQKIRQGWFEIQQIAVSVPSAGKITRLLKQVSAPADVTMLGLDRLDETEALHYAHYLRSQLTVSKLGRMLGLWE
jgi:glycerol-1-phosphate dehydrogenase [NAD(P)+]